MKRLVSVALGVIAILLIVTAPSLAAPHGGRGFSGPHPGAHFEGHPRFEGHRHFDRHGGVFIGVGPSFYWGSRYYSSPAYMYPPAYAYAAPDYWYYCPSYGVYYPNVPSCPVPWVPVPAQ